MRRETIEKLAVVYEMVGGRPPSKAVCSAVVDLLDGYGDEAVCGALDRCAGECRGHLAPADIISRIDDGRPGPDEAWGLVPKSDADSAVWTDEMAEAFGVCADLIDRGDMVAARRTFLEAYEARLKTARARRTPVRWQPTLGTNVGGREKAVMAAVQKNRISAGQASLLLPENTAGDEVCGVPLLADAIRPIREILEGCLASSPGSVERGAPYGNITTSRRRRRPPENKIVTTEESDEV